MIEVISWLLSFGLLVCLVAILAYQLICLTDLEFDYVNPFDCASRINALVMPEFAIQGALCFFYLVRGHWFLFLLTLPNLYYNARLYKQRRHLVDVTEIFNQLQWEKKQRLFKLFCALTSIALSLFWIIWSYGGDEV